PSASPGEVVSSLLRDTLTALPGDVSAASPCGAASVPARGVSSGTPGSGSPASLRESASPGESSALSPEPAGCSGVLSASLAGLAGEAAGPEGVRPAGAVGWAGAPAAVAEPGLGETPWPGPAAV